jgi:hypothetical protein
LPLSFFPLSPIFVSPCLKTTCFSQAVHGIRQTAITPTTRIRHMTSLRFQMNSDKLYFELRNTIPRAIKPQTNLTFARVASPHSPNQHFHIIVLLTRG